MKTWRLVVWLACCGAAPFGFVTQTAEAGLVYPEVKVTAIGGASGDRFGESVAISGDTAIVGADNVDVAVQADQGVAYVFVRSGGGWTLQQQLSASDGAAGDLLGARVAVSGDTAVVGAPHDDEGANTDQGSAYIFVRSGGTWYEQAKLTASDGAAGDTFGSCVAISGDTVVVGAEYDDVGPNVNQGSAYVFVRSGGTWSEQAKLVASDGTAVDRVSAVAVSGETAVVGAWYANAGGALERGAAYVFVRSGATWSEQARLVAPDGMAYDFFGGSVALVGNTALVGAAGADLGANGEQGAAYLFVRSGGTWSQRAKLVASDGAANDYFGASVALSGDAAVVGASSANVGANMNQGAAYLFVPDGEGWSQQAKLVASDGAANDYFGVSVALSGGAAVVGAPPANVGANVEQGSAYLIGVYPERDDADVSASASAGSPAPAPGDTVSLVVGVSSLGPATAHALLVRAVLPEGLTYLSHAASVGTYDPASGIWNAGSLSFGMSATLTIQALVEPSAAGAQPVFGIATVGTDTNNANNSATVTMSIGAASATLQSQAAYDGWVLESSETSSRGGKANVRGTTLFVGDDAADRQYRAILCFDTSALPDNAVITSATLNLKSAGIKGRNPFGTHRRLVADVRSGSFSDRDTLQPSDFRAPASLSGAGTIGKKPTAGWHSATLSAGALGAIDKTGLTQLRLRFARDDDNDGVADYLKLYSGNAAPALRPTLAVTYTLP